MSIDFGFPILLQQWAGNPMHAAQLFCDRVIQAKLLLRQPLDPPDISEKFADLFLDVVAVLPSHEATSFAAMKLSFISSFLVVFIGQ